jgi:hypothetical protein
MIARLWHIPLILMFVLAAGCTPEPQVIELPTLAVLPSLTPSDTPSPTPTFTPTLTPTATFTATITPSRTPTATLTPTSTLTPTNTVTPSPTASLTPTLTPTPNTPAIIDFTASASSAPPGSAVSLRWVSVADVARIDQLNQQGAVVQTFSVPPSGELAISIPANQGRLVVYRLVALRGGQEASRSVPIQVTCPIAWFFGNEFAPANSGCPVAVGAVAAGKFQPFERGVMIYVTANGLNRIYGLQNEGGRFISYANGWNGSDLDYDNPPSDRRRPQEEFRWAFLNTLAPVGTWQNALGWATADINRDSRTIQFEDTGAFYIDSPIGVYRFSGGDAGTWTKVK